MTLARYVCMHRKGALKEIALKLEHLLSPCRLCPRKCGINRIEHELGRCGTGKNAIVAHLAPHFGEESVLVGARGSGTVFFSGCNIGCVFCQNWDISMGQTGKAVSTTELSEIFLEIQGLGCHNLNLVTPTHVIPQIVAALDLAAAKGLNIPLVYNCGGYESPQTLELLEGMVDIYMPDLKTLDKKAAKLYLDAQDYPNIVTQALTIMHRQVGDLKIEADGLAAKGLLVRHLVMPEDQATTAKAAEFLANLSLNTYVNLMAQYRPCYHAHRFPKIQRSIVAREYERAKEVMVAAGLSRFDR